MPKIYAFGLSGRYTKQRARDDIVFENILDLFINDNAEFILDDDIGASWFIQNHLTHKNYNNATVYYSCEQPRTCLNPNWNTNLIKSYDISRNYFTKQRIQLCEDADIGFAMFVKNEITTERSIRQMQNAGKPLITYDIITCNFELFNFDKMPYYESEIKTIISEFETLEREQVDLILAGKVHADKNFTNIAKDILNEIYSKKTTSPRQLRRLVDGNAISGETYRIKAMLYKIQAEQSKQANNIGGELSNANPKPTTF